VPLTISAGTGGFGLDAGDEASERDAGCAAGGFALGDCDETLGALGFGATVLAGFGADAVEALLIGGGLPGVLAVEEVVLVSFGAAVLVAGG
jgi:hypothetical protein